jgi:hypothetical protein
VPGSSEPTHAPRNPLAQTTCDQPATPTQDNVIAAYDITTVLDELGDIVGRDEFAAQVVECGRELELSGRLS